MRIVKTSAASLKKLTARILEPDPATEDPEIGAIAIDFRTPRSLDVLFNEIDQLQVADGYISPERIRAALQSMISDGDLAECPTSDIARRASKDAPLAILDAIIRLSNQIAMDVAAYGDDEAIYSQSNGTCLAGTLESILHNLMFEAKRMRNMRPAFIEKQLDILGIKPEQTGLKLHIGCGASRLEGWVNIDLAPAPLSLNLLWGLPFRNQSVDLVYASHVLEHFQYKDEALHILREFKRVLAPGGLVRIVVPDTELLINKYVEHDTEFFNRWRARFYWCGFCKTRLEHLLRFSGASLRPSDFFRHKFGYDFETLRHVLAEAGFGIITRSKFMSSANQHLLIDNIGMSSGLNILGNETSLFVEAT